MRGTFTTSKQIKSHQSINKICKDKRTTSQKVFRQMDTRCALRTCDSTRTTSRTPYSLKEKHSNSHLYETRARASYQKTLLLRLDIDFGIKAPTQNQNSPQQETHSAGQVHSAWLNVQLQTDAAEQQSAIGDTILRRQLQQSSTNRTAQTRNTAT